MTRKNYGWRLLGEFLVIFIGVLLAFSVDRWWENRKLYEEEVFSLQSIKEDLMKDTSVYNSYQIPLNTEKLEKLNQLMILLKDGNTQLDQSNIRVAQAIMGVNNWPVTKTYYNTLKENGNLRIIRDKELRSSIVNYYEAISGNTEFANESHLHYFQDIMLPYILENADLIEVENSISIFKDKKFRNMVVMLISSVDLKVQEYKRVSKASTDMIEKIDVYLKAK